MIGWRQDHFWPFGDDHRLQHIHHLRDVGHPHAVCVAGEDVDVHRGSHAITQGLVLLQEHLLGARFRLQPYTPLIDDKRNMFLRIIFIHDLLMLLDRAFHPCGLHQYGGIILFAKAGR